MEAKQCFVCGYAGSPCERARIEGTLKRIYAPPGARVAPSVWLEEADGAVSRVILTKDDYSLARALLDVPDDGWRDLPLRVWHVAAAEGASDGATWQASEASLAVLAPDILLNITDLNIAEMCARQYPLRRMVPSPPNAATIRGNIVHRAFQEMVKTGQDDPTGPLAAAIGQNAIDLALHKISANTMRDDAMPHMQALAAWVRLQRNTLWRSAPRFETETLLLTPEIGLRGRMDFLMRDERGQSLIELKTGEARGQVPKRAHRWQVYGYHALLAARARPGGAPPQASLLYSGTPAQAEAHGVPFTPRDLRRVVELRNRLAIIAATGAVPRPPAPATCGRCFARAECATASAVLGWEPPPVSEVAHPVPGEVAASVAAWHEMLRLEGRVADDDIAALWQLSAAERAEVGTALINLRTVGEPEHTAAGEWRYTFETSGSSDLREGDQVLVSDSDPIGGEVVMGTVLEVSERGLRLWTPERIEHPRQVDRYSSDLVNDRTQRNLWRWLGVEPRLQALVAGAVPPRFDDSPAVTHPDLNDEQRMAATQALRARDFLLVRGPPGTGKTAVVAQIVREAVARGERVLLAAFTNQALDNAVRRVLAVGTPGVVRLGHDIATADDLKPWRLVARTRERLGLTEEDDVPPEALRETLSGARVVASTAATWAADRYDEVGEPLRVDLAIIDEASQLTIPATLGALRFAQRFVLVGDERQLPPLVRSEAAAAQGLSKSLFSRLDERWGAQATVGLTRQYRMHPVICAFPSAEYYHGQLHAAGDALAALLPLDPAEPDAMDYLMLPEHPLVFVDVRAMPEERPGKASHAQADVAARVVRTLRRRGLPGSEIGIIAPYRAQVAAIRRRLAASGEHEVTVDTVDRFQGAERSVIILSFGGDAGLAGRTRDFLADPHRLNVALTRARQKLILLGHRDALSRVPALERLIRYAGGLYGGQGGHGRIVVRASPAAADVAEVAPDVDTSPQLPGPTVTR